MGKNKIYSGGNFGLGGLPNPPSSELINKDKFHVAPELLKHSNTLALRTSEYINLKTVYNYENI